MGRTVPDRSIGSDHSDGGKPGSRHVRAFDLELTNWPLIYEQRSSDAVRLCAAPGPSRRRRPDYAERMRVAASEIDLDG
jgi:hypothetical protein